MDLLKEISGLRLDDERMGKVLEAYRPVLKEIEKLRQLDLRDVHPAVLFDPSQPYRASDSQDKK